MVGVALATSWEVVAVASRPRDKTHADMRSLARGVTRGARIFGYIETSLRRVFRVDEPIGFDASEKSTGHLFLIVAERTTY